jgi:hypothetical protein
MFITKYPIIIDTTSQNSATGGYFYSSGSPNGFIHAVEYTQSTGNAVPTTSVLSLYVGSTVRAILAFTASTSLMRFPRGIVVDSTNVQDGASTNFPVACFPVSGTDRLVLGITGGTSAATTGLVSVYIQGN